MSWTKRTAEEDKNEDRSVVEQQEDDGRDVLDNRVLLDVPPCPCWHVAVGASPEDHGAVAQHHVEKVQYYLFVRLLCLALAS